jgi:hypothetical protein
VLKYKFNKAFNILTHKLSTKTKKSDNVLEPSRAIRVSMNTNCKSADSVSKTVQYYIC